MIQQDGCFIVEGVKPNLPWLVMVHGVSQDHRIFNKQVEAFSVYFNLLLIDLPGHGISSDSRGPYDLVTFGLHIESCLLANQISDVVFWGTHLGASAGLVLAFDSPGLFRTLVLESPVFPGRALPSVSDLLARIAWAAKNEGIASARELWWNEGPWFDLMRQYPDRYRAIEHRRIVDDFSGSPWLDNGLLSKPIEAVEERLLALKIPTVLINGEHDVGDFKDAAKALQNLIPICHRIQVPGGGGFPLWEVPDMVNSLVSEAIGLPSLS